jgi:dienelactone hydrolase
MDSPLSNLLIRAVFLSPDFSCRSQRGSHHIFAHEESGLDCRMRAFACRSLDWCVIQVAARHVKRLATPTDGPATLNRVLGERDFFRHSVGSGIDLVPADDGSFAYPSPIISPFPENNTVFGRFFRAGDNWRRYPTAILLHGWNASWLYRHTMPWLARRLVAANLNAAMIELPYHMQRRPRHPRSADFLSADLAATRDSASQALADIRALLDWFCGQGVPRVGVWGFSLGAWLAGLLARYDSRLGFAVLTTPMTCIDRAIQELAFFEPVRKSRSRLDVDIGWLNLASQPARIDRSNILLMASQYDLFVPPDTVEELWHAWNRPEIWRLPHGHISLLASRSSLVQASDWIVRKTTGTSWEPAG